MKSISQIVVEGIAAILIAASLYLIGMEILEQLEVTAICQDSEVLFDWRVGYCYRNFLS